MDKQTENGSAGKKAPLVVDSVFEDMLDRIVTGTWPVGFTLPSERDLIEEFGVSRGALREAILRLKTLGILKVSHGKRSVVSKMDSGILGRLFPLIMALNGEQTFNHVFQARLLLEIETVRLAAMHRSEEDLKVLEGILADMDEASTESPKDWASKDLSIHLEIARASKNPLYEPMLETLSGYLAYIQTIGIDGYPERQKIAGEAHHEIVDAIRNQNLELAQARMEDHVRSGAEHILTYHLLSRSDGENRAAYDGGYGSQPRYRLNSDLVTKGLAWE